MVILKNLRSVAVWEATWRIPSKHNTWRNFVCTTQSCLIDVMHAVWWTEFCRTRPRECQKLTCSLFIKSTDWRLGCFYGFLNETALFVNMQRSYVYSARTTVLCNDDRCICSCRSSPSVLSILHDSVVIMQTWTISLAIQSVWKWQQGATLIAVSKRSFSFKLASQIRRERLNQNLHLQFCSGIFISLEKLSQVWTCNQELEKWKQRFSPHSQSDH
jgi:hypothetical protein